MLKSKIFVAVSATGLTILIAEFCVRQFIAASHHTKEVIKLPDDQTTLHSTGQDNKLMDVMSELWKTSRDNGFLLKQIAEMGKYGVL